MDLSVIIPAYNEQWRIVPTILEIADYLDSRKISYEIIVVDDGSSDSTKEVLARLQKLNPLVCIISFSQNRGKGAAVREGMLAAGGARRLFVDADGATPIAEVERLIRALDAGYDIAIGSRALPSNETRVTTRVHRKFLGRIFNWFVNTFLLPDITDSQCGFKLFTDRAATSVFSQQILTGFSFDVEILFVARKMGLKTSEVAVNWTNIPWSKVNVLFDGLRMLRDLARIRFYHRKIDNSK